MTGSVLDGRWQHGYVEQCMGGGQGQGGCWCESVLLWECAGTGSGCEERDEETLRLFDWTGLQYI